MEWLKSSKVLPGKISPVNFMHKKTSKKDINRIIEREVALQKRQGEILSLKWPYASLSRRTVTIMESKNGEKRSIPLNRKALEILTTQLKGNHLKSLYVFASRVGTRILKRNIARAFYKAMEYGKVENFRFHDLRHTFATRLAQGGIDIYKIAKLLGHKDIRMTQRYAHHCTDRLRSGVEYLDKKDTIWTQSEETTQSASC